MSTVSAIVSAYYAAEYLGGRLDNLLAQTPRPEIIVICQQGTPEAGIAMRKDVTAILTPGIPTIYEAWNLGIQAATGDYVTNANSDDRLYPGALHILSRALDEHPEAVLAYADDDIVREIDGDPVNRHEWITGSFEALRQACFIGPMPMWRKQVHAKHGYFDEEMRAAGDYEFWLRLASRGLQFVHIPRAIGAYLTRGDSAERREALRTVWETARARSRYTTTL